MTRFVHLNLHTEYSVVDGILRIKPMMSTLADHQAAAVAVTDQSNLYAAVKHYRAAQSAGIKPLIGADLRLTTPEGHEDYAHFIALCQNYQGYQNLSELISRCHTHGQDGGFPMATWAWLEELSEGLIILSGGKEGEIGQLICAGNLELAAERCQAWQTLFGDRYYLELQRVGRKEDELVVQQSLDLAAEFGIPVVATNAARFLKTSDFDAHEARVCINEGRTLDDTRRPKRFTDQQYLKSPEEMQALFEDVPEAIDNTWYIAQRCTLEFNFKDYFLPNFPIPEGMSIDDYLRQVSREGLETRLDVLLDREAEDFTEKRKIYDERLEKELDVIISMGFPGYFLIVADFIQWGKDNAIPVGPGRGSGAGSLVAYALKITDLDPLAYDLLFERFLNPERVSMPDFDIDFCMDRRDEVIAYVARKYGRDHVSQIITHGTMAAKAVVRDCGRVLGLPYGMVDQISKLIPFDLKMTLQRALDEEEALRERYEKEEDVHELIDLALQLEGTVRNVGKHAGGVVIAPSKMSDFVPLYCDAGSSSVVCQYDMVDVESIGLVKFDFLGLRTLTIIDWAVRDANIQRKAEGLEPIHIDQLPIDDADTYKVFAQANTTAIFQFESRGMRDMLKRAKPDRLEDIIALVALYRPGPMDLIPDFIDRKHGKRFEYLHPLLEPVLESTFGIMVYQEQVMQAAQICAGYSLGGADLLRRAMGKKKPEEMAKQRLMFVEGARDKDIDEDKANEIFDYMEKFAGYGFNKSHAAAYALVAYQTAWLKAHYPAAFMAAVLSADMDNTDKVVGLIDECRNMGIDVLSPDVNLCDSKFTVQDAKTIRYGLGAIKGVGEAAIDGMVDDRQQQGPFCDLFELCRRLDTRKVNRRVLEALIRAGALDQLGPGRSSCIASLDIALKLAEQHAKNTTAGQNDMFGLAAEPSAEPEENAQYVRVREWSEEERLAGEKQTLGLYLSGHPIDRYDEELKSLVSARLNVLKTGKRRVAGQVIGLRYINGRRGKMAVAELDDKTGRLEVVVYSDVLEQFGEFLVKDRVIIIEGECREDNFSEGLAMNADKILEIERCRGELAKALHIHMDARQMNGQFAQGVTSLESTLTPFLEGPCRVCIDYKNQTTSSAVLLGERWRVSVPDRLLDQLRESFGKDAIHLEY